MPLGIPFEVNDINFCTLSIDFQHAENIVSGLLAFIGASLGRSTVEASVMQ